MKTAGNLSVQFCHKTFYEKAQLTKHIAAVHEKRKPFMCTSCPKAFGSKYKTHEKIVNLEGSLKEG